MNEAPQRPDANNNILGLIPLRIRQRIAAVLTAAGVALSQVPEEHLPWHTEVTVVQKGTGREAREALGIEDETDEGGDDVNEDEIGQQGSVSPTSD